MADRINSSYIKQFFGLSDTPEGLAELNEIVSSLKKCVFENGTDICTFGAESDGMYFIDSGAAVVLNEDGDQVNILHKGTYFGEYAALTGEKRLSTVRSLGRTVVYRLSNEDALRFISKHPEIYGELMKRVYSQVSGKHTQLMAVSAMRKGVLRHPSNSTILSRKQVAIHYGILIALFAVAVFIIPAKTTGPVFLVPLIFMPIYAILTRRTTNHFSFPPRSPRFSHFVTESSRALPMRSKVPWATTETFSQCSSWRSSVRLLIS